VAAGKIKFYGMATWNGFRQEAKAADSLFLSELEKIAAATFAGRCAPLPLTFSCLTNLAMTEALTLGNQSIKGQTRTMMEAGRAIWGITLVASAALLQGQLSQNLPGVRGGKPWVCTATWSGRCSFARSSPGITTALVGMSRAAHVEAKREAGWREARGDRKNSAKLF